MRGPHAITFPSHQLTKAQGENPNPFFAVATMPVQKRQGNGYESLPIVTASTEGMYDIETQAGEIIIIK